MTAISYGIKFFGSVQYGRWLANNIASHSDYNLGSGRKYGTFLYRYLSLRNCDTIIKLYVTVAGGQGKRKQRLGYSLGIAITVVVRSLKPL